MSYPNKMYTPQKELNQVKKRDIFAFTILLKLKQC